MFRLLPLALLVLACGSDKEFSAAPPFEDVEDVKVWATSASAVSVYSHAYESIGVADGVLDYDDPACPVLSDDGVTMTVTNGCTDVNGREWRGTATVIRDGDARSLAFDGFDGNDGSVELRRVGASLREFDAELVIGGVTSIRYAGSIDGDYVGRAVFNGSGRVRREGYFSPTGTVEATTVDEVVDDETCSGQPVSG